MKSTVIYVGISTSFISGSLLKIQCNVCPEIINIPTGKRHGQNAWDINTKLGAGIFSTNFLKILFCSFVTLNNQDIFL